MKILFGGETNGNGGPPNVNKGFVQNLTKRFVYLRSRNRYLKYIEPLCKSLFCNVLVASGVSRIACMLVGLAKLFGKKSVYIMHGCAEYETVVNKQEHVESFLRQEKYLLEHADLILPVSERFMKWAQSRYPQYAGKMNYLYNGIDCTALKDLPSRPKKPGTIVAVGADRGVKNNMPLALAVEALAGEADLEIYGTIYHGVPNNDFRHVKYLDKLSHDAFLEKLGETELFVLNSIFESYGLSVIEALACGCSILVSEIAGVTGILALEESDIIRDPMDTEALQRKIRYLQQNPNNKRILSQLNMEEWSYGKAVERLEQLCWKLVNKGI